MSEKSKNQPEKSKEGIEASEKSQKQEILTWKNSSIPEKIGLVGSMFFLVVSIVFLIFEFKNDSDVWPYAGFDIAISLAFLSETLSNWRRKRSLAIITLVTGVAFLTLGILKFFGIL